jgi:hypothetical protein
MTLSESDRITITRYPPLPSSCAICNFSADGSRGFLDFQVSLDYYGAVVICEECVAPVAQLFGYVSQERYEASENSLMRVGIELERLQAENGKLNLVVDSLLAVRPDAFGNNSGSDEVSIEVTSEDPGQPELPIGESGRSNSETSKPATERRSKNVSQLSL